MHERGRCWRALAAEQDAGNPKLAYSRDGDVRAGGGHVSLMNVSDLGGRRRPEHDRAGGVQSAIALEALVSAAFILIGSKVGDLIGRKRAYVLGLLGYAIGALAMTLAQSLTAIIVFWAIIGGLGASLLLPAMQSLVHGNFEGRRADARLRAGRRGGPRSPPGWGRSSAASSPPISSWRRRVPPRGRRHRGRVVPDQARARCALHGPAPGRRGRHAILSVFGMGGLVLRDPRLAGGRGRTARSDC